MGETEQRGPTWRSVLESGRLGDIAVLNRDYFDRRAVNDADVKKINSVFTVLGGVVVHDTGALH